VGLEWPSPAQAPGRLIGPYPNGWTTRLGNQYDYGTVGHCGDGDTATLKGLAVDWDYFDPSLFQ
jgi:hypothetical protein